MFQNEWSVAAHNVKKKRTNETIECAVLFPYDENIKQILYANFFFVKLFEFVTISGLRKWNDFKQTNERKIVRREKNKAWRNKCGNNVAKWKYVFNVNSIGSSS